MHRAGSVGKGTESEGQMDSRLCREEVTYSQLRESIVLHPSYTWYNLLAPSPESGP